MAKQADFTHIERAARTRRIAGKVVVYALLTAWALMVLFPFYWMILSSLKSYSAYNVEYIPKFYTLSPTLENYVEAFTAVPLGRYFANTLIFTVATTALMLIVVTLAAFAFARLNFRGRNIAFAAFLSLMMIPNELVIITNFVTITNLNLRNTFTGLILPSVTSVFYIYLLKENFEQVPDQLYYAAKVDGTGDMKYLFKVLVPICRPTLTEHLNHHIVGGLIYEGNHDVLAIEGIYAVVVFLCGRVGYLPYEVPSKHIGQFISQLFDVILIDIAYLGGAHERQGVMRARNFAFL